MFSFFSLLLQSTSWGQHASFWEPAEHHLLVFEASCQPIPWWLTLGNRHTHTHTKAHPALQRSRMLNPSFRIQPRRRWHPKGHLCDGVGYSKHRSCPQQHDSAWRHSECWTVHLASTFWQAACERPSEESTDSCLPSSYCSEEVKGQALTTGLHVRATPLYTCFTYATPQMHAYNTTLRRLKQED